LYFDANQIKAAPMYISIFRVLRIDRSALTAADSKSPHGGSICVANIVFVRGSDASV